MPRPRTTSETPPCYAIVPPGLEEIAGDEIVRDFKGEIKKTYPGVVVFRVPEVDKSILNLRTTDDVFALAWGTDQLTYRADDLDLIQKWTAKQADWDRLLQVHHAVRPKPKGKPSIHFVTQMMGEHGYRRTDARKAFLRGLGGKFPPSWKVVDENASIEIWLTINEAVAVAGIRLSDQSMRHRTYKLEHFPASLRPTIAAALVRLADLKPNHTVLDPMCGAGTILAEAYLSSKSTGYPMTIIGGDIDPHHVRAAVANFHRFQELKPQTWDARQLPLEDETVDRILCNPPFGKQMGSPAEILPLYRQSVREMDRVLKPGGKTALLVTDVKALKEAVEKVGWQQQRHIGLRVLGRRANMFLFRKNK